MFHKTAKYCWIEKFGNHNKYGIGKSFS